MLHQKGFAHILIVIFITIIAAGVVGAAWYYQENKDEVTITTNTVAVNDSLKCHYLSDKCRDGYVCYLETSGGLSVDGPLLIEPIGGDQQCHKECQTNSNCTAGETCVDTFLSREDFGEQVQFCIDSDMVDGVDLIEVTSTDSETISNTNLAVDWETYVNEEYGFSVQYPAIFKASESRSASMLFSYIFEYPLDLTRGVQIQISQKGTDELTSSLLIGNGTKNIGGENWHAFTYDPKNDPGATDQSKSVTYLLEREGKTIIIYTPLEISWPTYTSHTGEEIQGMTVEEVDTSVAKILSTFQFID